MGVRKTTRIIRLFLMGVRKTTRIIRHFPDGSEENHEDHQTFS
jgi:hypothetical protein